MAREANIKIVRGESITLSLTDDTGGLTGASMSFTAKDTRGADGAAVISRTTASGISVTSDTAYTVSIPASVTRGVAAGDYAYEIFRTDSGNESCRLRGTLTVLESNEADE